MVLIKSFILLYATFYALGLRMDRLNQFGTFGLFYGLIPGAMVLMSFGMLYGASDFFKEDSDMPLWAFCTAVFFGVTLIIALYGYVQILRSGGLSRRPDH